MMTHTSKMIAVAALALATLAPGYASAADMAVKVVKPVVVDPPFFIVNDNRFTYAYAFTATDPGDFTVRPDGSIKSTTAKKIVGFSHFDIWAYGTNFFAVDLIKSDSNDPAIGCAPALAGCAGATEIYGLYRSTIGWNQLFNTKAFAIGPMKNVSFLWGADANTKNDAVAPAKRDIVGGLAFDFMLPYNGNFTFAPQFYKEWNHNAFTVPGLPNGNTEYRATWRVGLSYNMDLGFLPSWLPLSISGNATWTGKKGPQNSPLAFVPFFNAQTAVELNSEPIRLTLDASKMVMGEKYSHFVDLWVAYKFWKNKFGLDSKLSVVCTVVPGGPTNNTCTEESVYAGMSVKF